MLCRTHLVFRHVEGVCAMTLLLATVILVAIASVACAARSPLIWSIEVAPPLFAPPLLLWPRLLWPLFLWPLFLWPLFVWLSVFVADLALQKNRHFGLQIVMEMLDARGQVWLRRFNLMVLAVVLAFFPHPRVAQHDRDASPALRGRADARLMASRVDVIVGFALMLRTVASLLFGRDCGPAAPESDA
jgi:hypothetical protein